MFLSDRGVANNLRAGGLPEAQLDNEGQIGNMCLR